MDVSELLRELRERRGLSQAQLADAAGTSRAAVSAYESGRKSPTVATLNRLLAAVGLQLRAELEPLLAALEERVAAVAEVVQPLSDDVVGALRRVAAALEGEHPFVVDRGWGEEPERGSAAISWGFDGETALRLHGLGFAVTTPTVAVVLDATVRTYLFQQRVRGTGGPPVSWFEATRAQVQRCLGDLAIGPFGMVRVRVLDDVAETVRVEAAPGLVVPVLTVEAVEGGRPDLGEVLLRLRERRLREGRARSLGA